MCYMRNIPAHAGKTAGFTVEAFEGMEHPRARGENIYKTEGYGSAPGTSPRTRGKLPR